MILVDVRSNYYYYGSMIRPQYIRFVFSSDKSYQINSSSKILNSFTCSPTIITPKHMFISSALNIKDSTTCSVAPEPCQNTSLSIVETASGESNLSEVVPTKNLSSSTNTSNVQVSSGKNKRNLSPSAKKKQRNRKKSNTKTEQTNLQCIRRTKNWSEHETIIFIGIWSDNYVKLTSASCRHSTIYQSMANQLNDTFKDRNVSAADVKAKIGNLTTEYRRKAKEQGEKGASPCTWRYFDLLDKLLGKRTHKNDSLLTDSMIIEQEKLSDDINNVQIPATTLMQVAKQLDDSCLSHANAEEINSPARSNSNYLSSPEGSISTSAMNTPTTTNIDASSRRGTPTQKRKKKTSEIKIGLIEQLLTKIDSANEAMLRSEVKISTCELRTAANLFSIGRNTAGEILHDFCSTLVDSFFNRFIRFPETDNEIERTIGDFLDNYGYAMCAGYLDGTHISINPPNGEEFDYFNYKKHHFVILLAVVNASLQLTYVNVDSHGRCNDSLVYRRSQLAEVIQRSRYANHYMKINNVKTQVHIIDDSDFALHKTLMKPYPSTPKMPPSHVIYNYQLSRCRSTVERVSILRNLCLMNGDELEIEWDLPLPTHKKSRCNMQTTSGVDARQALTDYFLQNPL
ncbi:unnamed protein product [Rotaria socialis]